MKNIFKFMGVALMACSLIMVSCKKDDEDNVKTYPGLTLTWGGATPNLNYLEAVTNGYTAMFGAAADLNGEDIVPPYFSFAFGRTTTDTAVLAEYIQIDTLGHTLADYYPSFVVDENKDVYFFAGLRTQPTWGAFDATNYTISCDLNMVFYNDDQLDRLIEEAGKDRNSLTTEELRAFFNQCDQKDVVLKMDNFQFTYQASSK